MKLFFKKTGEGKPLIILHGLFGLSDNWSSLAKSFSEYGFCCYIVDLRNHGRSPHSDQFDYSSMADDIFELIQDEKIGKADVIGHSMGGKVAMFFAMKYPGLIRKMIVVDIAPRYYSQHHQSVFAALNSVNLSIVTSRKEVEELLRNGLNEESTIQFLLKNLYWKTDKQLDWRFGLMEIEKNIENVGVVLPGDDVINVPTLFIRGSRSGYIGESDEAEIKKRFSDVDLKTVSNAGHWVHAENPNEFFEVANWFLLNIEY